MNKIGRLIILILILLAIAAGVYFGVQSLIESKKRGEQVSQTISEQLAASSTDQTTQNKYVDNIPTSTTTTPNTWKSHNYPGLNFTIAYPINAVARTDDSSVVITFPKDSYFHWPLQDDAKITVTASSTCGDMLVPRDVGIATTTFSLNGYAFTAMQGDDAAAGNRYYETVYDTEGNGICYRIDLFIHGTAGAALYVSDPALIDKYDSQHAKDIATITAVFNSIANSFRMNAQD